MTDRWGRPNFNDGAQLYQGLRMVKADQDAARQGAIEAEAYTVADTLAQTKGAGDLSKFSPQAKYAGAKLYWSGKVDELRSKTQEHLLSQAGVQDKMSKLQLNLQEADEKYRQYRVARASGDETTARAIALSLNNENMYTGRYVEPGEDGYAVTGWDGKTEKVQDIPIEQVDQMLGAYFNKTPEEIMDWQLGAENFRSKSNYEKISQAEPLYNDKTGKVIYKVPPGVWGPDGKPRGAFYVDDPVSQNEVPAELAKDFVPLPAAVDIARIGAQKESANASRSSANANKVLNPANVVSAPGGQQGLLMQQGGGIGFKPIQGVPQAPAGEQGGLTLPRDAGAEKSALELKKRNLDAALMAIPTPKNAMYMTGQDEGAIKLEYATDILRRSQEGGLTPEEQRLIPAAQTAVQLYQEMVPQNQQQKIVVRTGKTKDGRRVVKYSDGSLGYPDEQ